MDGQEDEITKLKRLLEEERKKNEEQTKRIEEERKKNEEQTKKIEEERMKNEEKTKKIEEERKKSELLEEKNKQLERQLEETTKEGVNTKTDSPGPKKNKGIKKEKVKDSGWRRTLPTGHMGFVFEIRLIALLFLRCLRMYETFILTGNVDEFNPFDDILLEYKLDEHFHTYLMQLKHSHKDKTLTHGNLHRDKRFNLEKYNKGYCKLKEKAEITKRFFENVFSKWNFILFHNCELDDDGTIQETITEDQVLYFEGGTVHRIENIKCKMEPCVDKECEFLKKFRLYMKQPCIDELDNLIEGEIAEHHYKTLCHFAHDIALDFTRNVENWYANEKRYLNERSRHIIDDASKGKCEPEVEDNKRSYKSGTGEE